jgi:Subtilisin inhibitor-like
MAVISLASAKPGRYLLAGIVVGSLALAGCSASPAQSAHGGGGGSAKVALKFQVEGDAGSGKPKTLTCDPAGGSQPAAAAACSVLLKLKNPFAPIAKEMNCPMLLRSNTKILVTGTWFGDSVHRLVVDGGCDMALFDSLHKIGLTS